MRSRTVPALKLRVSGAPPGLSAPPPRSKADICHGIDRIYGGAEETDRSVRHTQTLNVHMHACAICLLSKVALRSASSLKAAKTLRMDP
jgi:hypothetical protein